MKINNKQNIKIVFAIIIGVPFLILLSPVLIIHYSIKLILWAMTTVIDLIYGHEIE